MYGDSEWLKISTLVTSLKSLNRNSLQIASLPSTIVHPSFFRGDKTSSLSSASSLVLLGFDAFNIIHFISIVYIKMTTFEETILKRHQAPRRCFFVIAKVKFVSTFARHDHIDLVMKIIIYIKQPNDTEIRRTA